MQHTSVQTNKDIAIVIDGKRYDAKIGQTILEVARENGIYIPTMCYLKKLHPIASCRMCLVAIEEEGKNNFVLSCQERVVDGLHIQTDSKELFRHRQNIMKLYNVNHPLQCGVCDKSGECDLQNKTLDFKIQEQIFSIVEPVKAIEQWDFINYDPSLCIMCERCVHVCNEIIGDNALEIFSGGYKSKISRKIENNCSQCGECAAVCPVGALSSSNFHYTANAWELDKVPSSCSHCSAVCPLFYEVRNNKVLRVTNDFETETLCGGGRFGYDFALQDTHKNQDNFNQAIKAFHKADTIRFNSYITNEEAFILQKLKEKFGYRLINEDARRYQEFLSAYGKITGKSFYSGTFEDIQESDCIVCIGTRIIDDNPALKYAVNIASKRNRADFIYMHPLHDTRLQTIITQFVKYEAGSEEGLLAILIKYLLHDSKIQTPFDEYLENIDDGYVSAESNVGEEELAKLAHTQKSKTRKILIVGQELIGHLRFENIARFIGMIEKYADFATIIVPPQGNTVGVAKICDLDMKEGDFTVGYNAPGNFLLGQSCDADCIVASLIEQEGTLVNLEHKLKKIHPAITANKYCLNDFAQELGLHMRYTIEYTELLPQSGGFKQIAFDCINQEYRLDSVAVVTSNFIEDIEDIDAYNGSVICFVNQDNQFNYSTAKSSNLRTSAELCGSSNFAKAARIQDGDHISFIVNGYRFKKTFRIDDDIQGTIAICNFFDDLLSADWIPSAYRYQKVSIEIMKVQ